MLGFTIFQIRVIIIAHFLTSTELETAGVAAVSHENMSYRLDAKFGESTLRANRLRDRADFGTRAGGTFPHPIVVFDPVVPQPAHGVPHDPAPCPTIGKAKTGLRRRSYRWRGRFVLSCFGPGQRRDSRKLHRLRRHLRSDWRSRLGVYFEPVGIGIPELCLHDGAKKIQNGVPGTCAHAHACR